MQGATNASLFDAGGNRKYLTQEERSCFLVHAKSATPEEMTFCMVLAYTGGRISEVLALTPDQIDFSTQSIIIESIKKRSHGVFRAVPVPASLLIEVRRVHSITASPEGARDSRRIWSWSRTTAWSKVTRIMKKAGLSGVRATPRGLRHAFGVSAIQAGIALNMVQKWMGHADLETTSIYTNAIGAEELSIARRLWNPF